MIRRTRIAAVLAATLALTLAAAPAVRADRAYDRVAAAYAQAGGRLDACFFTRAQLQAALAGIPKEIARYVPDLRKAIRDGIARHRSGGCAGRTPGVGNPGGAAATPPAPATPQAPTTTQAPATTVPAPTTAAPTTPATPATAPPAARHHRDTALLAALAALGALALALLALWALARARGWDPPALARARHAWGEAGYRTTSTWAEFTDWLRLGR